MTRAHAFLVGAIAIIVAAAAVCALLIALVWAFGTAGAVAFFVVVIACIGGGFAVVLTEGRRP